MASIDWRGYPGDSRHAHLILEEEALRKFSVVTTAINTEEGSPINSPTHIQDATSGAIANTTTEYKTKCEKFYTQQGTNDGLRDVIVDSINSSLICELKHKIWEYTHHSPLELIRHIKGHAIKQDVSKIIKLMVERTTLPTFYGNYSFCIQFGKLDELADTLQHDYKIKSSTMELITMQWLVYAQVKDIAFCEACLERNKQGTDQTWKIFKKLFSEADDDRHKHEAHVHCHAMVIIIIRCSMLVQFDASLLYMPRKQNNRVNFAK